MADPQPKSPTDHAPKSSKEPSDAAPTHTSPRLFNGGCHCGAVRYEVELDLGAGVNRCNCSFCTKTSVTSAMAKPSAFRLLSGEDSLADFHKDGSPVHHPFCKRCGVHAFGRGHLEELGGDYYSVNVNCLDEVDLLGVPVRHWDGRHDNWDAGPRDQPWPVRR